MLDNQTDLGIKTKIAKAHQKDQAEVKWMFGEGSIAQLLAYLIPDRAALGSNHSSGILKNF